MKDLSIENSIIKSPDIGFKDQLISETGNNMINPLLNLRLRDMDDFMVYEVSVTVPSTNAATATNYPTFYIATRQSYLLEVKLRHEANSTSGVVDVEKLISGTAKGSGVSMIASTFSIASGQQTVQRRLPTNTLMNAQLAPGDAVALKATGTLTNAQDVTVTLLFAVNNQNIPLSANV